MGSRGANAYWKLNVYAAVYYLSREERWRKLTKRALGATKIEKKGIELTVQHLSENCMPSAFSLYISVSNQS